MQQDPPPIVGELVDGCLRYVHEALGLELDFTQDTLPVLDHYVRMAPEQASQQVLELIGPMCGAYFGEVIRRHLQGARWHAPSDDFASWRIEFGPCFLHFNPVGMAIEAMLQEDAEGWAGHIQVRDEDREALKESLEQLGQVPEEDFYRLSVRFEVIEQAHVFLTQQSTHEGKEPPHFGPEDYEAAIRKAAQTEQDLN